MNNNNSYIPPPNFLQPTQQQNLVKVVAGYALQEKLGSGSFAVVYKGVKLSTGEESGQQHDTTTANNNVAAIKAIARTSEKLTKKVLQNLEVEISILRNYRHRNIVCMHEVQKTENHFYLILEYCAGGDVQHLIRTRKQHRLSEQLTRRLMRDLASGLKFLWSQELIHRDIKPQNLLLTGPLPIDEINDPECTVEKEELRRIQNFPSDQFCLKIADFGFARHLQNTNLAETLCGSPLYMAPEILQHHRYDAKADLWSVGTVLFEMISGDPPFHGENHIDLLRNIQRKAVRLPKDVRVSKECVTLLRLLLSRNPLSRAGFDGFFKACADFVALGCQGVPTADGEGTFKRPSTDHNLGTIPENNDGGSTTSSSPPAAATTSESLMTVATNAPNNNNSNLTRTLTKYNAQATSGGQAATPQIVSNPIPIPGANSSALAKAPIAAAPKPHFLSPLVPSPPTSSGVHMPVSVVTATEYPTTTLSSKKMPQPIEMPTRRGDETPPASLAAAAGGGGGLQSSTDENSFVMVEQPQQTSPPQSANATGTPTTAVVSHHSSEPYNRSGPVRNRLEPSPPASMGFLLNRAPSLPREYTVVKPPKGMLSTSPGTGGALMGMLTGRPRLVNDNAAAAGKQLESQIKSVSKMQAAAEDVGRRAISVAHLGDKRAYLAMRLLEMKESATSSFASASPMEGIEEEDGEQESGTVTDDSCSTEVMSSVRRRRSSSSATDKSMTDARVETDEDEMPFAVKSESVPIVSAGIPSRSSVSFSKDIVAAHPTPRPKPTPAVIRVHFSEALSCYLKALKMLKGAVGAAETVSKELDTLSGKPLGPEQTAHIAKSRNRNEITLKWLGDQFRGVLERADAANTQIGKMATSHSEVFAITSIEELLYVHALGMGREGAVKQLLGHYEAARSCYRSAGLLAETLLMEPKVEGDDRSTLEGYVDGFAAQITELDQLLLVQSQQQSSRLAGSSTTTSSLTNSRRGPPVIGLGSHPFVTSVSPK